MAYTFWDALLATAQELAITREGVATGGTTTTLIDTGVRLEGDDYWNQGTLFFLDADGAESYNNYVERITNFDQATSTLTIPTVTQAPAAGDRYIIADARYSIDMLKGAINAILRRVQVVDVDESLTTAASQTEYTLPTTILRGKLRYVYLQTTTDDANDNRWNMVRDWRVEDGDTGVADTLVFLSQPTASRTIQLHYVVDHPQVITISTGINEVVNLRGLSIRAAIHCLRSRMAMQKKDEWAGELMNFLLDEQARVPLVNRVYPYSKRQRKVEYRSND